MDRARGFGVALLAVAAAVTALLLAQYLTVVLGAIMLAYLLHPAYRRVAPVIGETSAAVGLIVTTTLLIVIPFILLVRVIITGLSDIRERIGQGDDAVGGFENALDQVYGGTFDIERTITQYIEEGDAAELLNLALEAIGGVMAAVISLTILALLTYALLTDGEDLMDWIGEQVPLNDEEWRALLDHGDTLMYAVIIGNVIIAVVDGTMVGLALFVLGFSSVPFWTMMAIFTALIPIVGSTIVWVPAAGYLLITGETVAGVALLLFGGIGIGVVDNVLRSYVGAHEAGLNPALFIVGIFSGLALIGPMGLFFGPIALAMAKRVVEVIGGREADIPASEDTG